MPLSSTQGKTRINTAAAVSIQTGVDDSCNIIGPAKIHRVGLHVTVAKTTGTAGVFTIYSVAGLTETSLGTFTTPDTMAAGEVLYKDFNPPLEVGNGKRAKIEQTTNANAGSAVIFMEYWAEPLVKSYLDGLVALT